MCIRDRLTISDYNYNAVPVYRPQIGPASVSPFEFIAAARMDKAEEDNTDVISDARSVDLESPKEQDGEDDDDEETVEEDFLPLPEFLGAAAYMNCFINRPKSLTSPLMKHNMRNLFSA